jgi:hypothetical protein
MGVFNFYYLRHNQPINVPTAGAQAFLIDHPHGERAITHHSGSVRIGVSRDKRNTTGTNGLTCLPKHGGARDIKFLVTHSMTDQCCLAYAIVCRAY